MVSKRRGDGSQANATGYSVNTVSRENSAKFKKYYQEIYKVYEFDDGLYFPDMKFRCGSIDNYVKTGVLSAEEVEEIWNEQASLK